MTTALILFFSNVMKALLVRNAKLVGSHHPRCSLAALILCSPVRFSRFKKHPRLIKTLQRALVRFYISHALKR
jgi:hypothetical protein